MNKDIEKQDIQSQETEEDKSIAGNDSGSKDIVDINTENEDGEKIASAGASNTHLRRLISSNYLEYSSYVIKERAIPELKDGMKPVQRRILWSLYRMDDGKFHKVANVVGYTMQYHPHGDSSIYGALVNLANKEYFIDKQGNFGNIFTGDEAAAARYIEARLTPLGREVMFNPEITDFIDSYDGRNKEPVALPAKVPALLMVGQEGIAPGMTTRILSHNFKELLEAQIAVLKKEEFVLYPDFFQGGIMDVAEYADGEGKITLRAKIDIEGRKLFIREIPAFTTTENLMASIEKAVNKNKIKLASISDYTAECVEIELIPARGYNPEKALKALYTYTDCSMSVSSSILVIRENKPVLMTVSEIVRECTDYLVLYLKRELQIELDKLNERYHDRTLERIFIENRIYKRIEECETYELVKMEVLNGLKPFLSLLKREVNDKDIEKLLAIPIRRISKFDINKNKEETEKILAAIKEVEKNLRQIISFTIKYIEKLIETYAVNFPRKTRIQEFEEIDKKAAALNNIKVGWDRRNCYIGESVKSDDIVTCNEYDHLICIEKSGAYKIISIPQKIYIGRLYYFNKYDKDNVYSIIYKEKKTGTYYSKRCQVSKFIKDKDYNLIPEGCQLEQLTIRDNSIYECVLEKSKRQKDNKVEIDFSQVQMRNPGTRGFKLTDRKIKKISFLGFAEIVEEIEDDKTVETVKAKDANDAEEKKNVETVENNKAVNIVETVKDIRTDKKVVNAKGAEEVKDVKADKEVVNAKGSKNVNVGAVSTYLPDKDVKDKDDKDNAGSTKQNDGKKQHSQTKKKSKKITNDNKPNKLPQEESSKEKKKNIENIEDKDNKKILENKKTEVEEIKHDKTIEDEDDEDWGIIQPDLGF